MTTYGQLTRYGQTGGITIHIPPQESMRSPFSLTYSNVAFPPITGLDACSAAT
jgi:hypothetical protein